ncbi:neuroglian-like [Planococcus citri]|uniref:neuroglian-like n=1 Tax=Planococcus citri TaxID=170843 RepID=UPI0031F8F065
MNLKQNLAIFCFIALVSTAVADQQNTPPRITDQPVEDVVFFRSNMSISIPCLAEGASPLNYTWKKNGIFLSGFNSTGSNGTLTFNNPTNNHTGEYQCFIQNEFGIARSNSVSLRKFDHFINGSNNATAGNPFNLTCNFKEDSMNKEQNYWSREQNDGKSEKIENDRMTLDPNGTLWISKIETSDSGNYSYIVPMQNNFLHKACQIELTVSISSGKDKPIPKTFQRYVSNKTEYAEYNKSKKLYCIYDGSESLKIIWKMNGTSLEKDTPDVALGKSQKYLEIKNFQWQNQSTNYSCKVTDDGVANKTKKTHNFSVIIVKPYFTEEPREVQIVENNTAEFDCKYAGAEYVDVEWTYNGIPIREATFYKNLNFGGFNDCAFKIENVTKNHTGNYGFKIFNKFGSVYKDVYLLVKDAEPVKPNTNSTEIENSTAAAASSTNPDIPDPSPQNTTDTSPVSTKPTDAAETGKVVTIVLVIASIILSIIVIFLIVMKCKTDSRYNEYELADHDHEANLGTTPEPNPSQTQPESSTNHSDSNHPEAKKRRGKHTKNNTATAE